jgi:hypothetical protein
MPVDATVINGSLTIPAAESCVSSFYGELFLRDFWIERAERFVGMSKMVLVIAFFGALLGLLSSFPVRLPRNGFRFVPCCACVAGVALVVRVLSDPYRIPKGQHLAPEAFTAMNTASVVATVIAAIVASSTLTTPVITTERSMPDVAQPNVECSVSPRLGDVRPDDHVEPDKVVRHA